MQHWFVRAFALAAAVVLLCTALDAAPDKGWGVIKGQVVFDGKAPKRTLVNVDKDKTECLKNGPLFGDNLIVNPKNKGIRWCLVYLMHASGNFKKNIPVHPKLKAIKDKTVAIDQPCCQFEPHLLAMREGQTLLLKNSADIPHNVHIVSGGDWSGINQLVPKKGQFKVEDIPANYIPYPVKCDIHGWMTGRLAVLKNPYFAVTDADGKFEIKDAPAGDFRLVISHDEGWVIGDKEPARKGKKITITGGATLDLGKIAWKPSK